VNALPAGLGRGGVPNQKGYKQFILLLVATWFLSAERFALLAGRLNRTTLGADTINIKT